jgi:hypothetical protein
VEYQELNSLIDRLAMSIDMPRDRGTDWKPVWNIIRDIGAGFKGVRYPSRDAHQAAWDKKQTLIERVKEAETTEFAHRKNFGRQSEEHKDIIKRMADNAKSDGGFGDVMLFLITGGLSHIGKQVLEGMLGKTDEVKEELDRRSAALKDAGAYLSENKAEMRGNDKKECFDYISDIRERLNQDWEEWKTAKSTAFENRKAAHEERQREFVEKQERWAEKQHDFIDMLETKNARLHEVLGHKHENLDKLRDMKRTARGDHEDRVESWIDECETSIREIEQKIESNDEKIREVRDKLRN